MQPDLGEGWTDEIRERCRDNCAFFGDPPCFRLPELTSDAKGQAFTPCSDCLAGIDLTE